jgi:hypothetical protein
MTTATPPPHRRRNPPGDPAPMTMTPLIQRTMITKDGSDDGDNDAAATTFN